MNICVVGWYLEKFDDFYASLSRIMDKHNVFVVANRRDNFLDDMAIPYVVRENTGLEWGAYNHYLMNIWPGGDTLFCHDDIGLNPIVDNVEIRPPEWIFDRIAQCGVDQAYIFGSRHEDVENYGQHGRMVFMSDAFLRKAMEMGGFFFDGKNEGYTSGEDQDLREKYGCLGYNAGIIAFHNQAKLIGGNVHRKIFIPAFDLAKRGVPQNKTLEYGKFTDKIGRMIETAKDKIHVGCGENVWPEYVNVDLHNSKADVMADAKSLPFDDSSLDLVEAHHLIEHLGKNEAVAALREWCRVLRHGGHVFLSCPDINFMAKSLLEAQGKPELWEGFIGSIYGTEESGMVHRYGYSPESIGAAFSAAGLSLIAAKTAIGFRPTPSVLAIAQKR